ncbi:hypothetical protein NXS19_011743 [Fusarium pseudograminearum]|nr:hypothetical protein NXS19_011743 [Fusarium pseudograminearum]
MIPISLAYLLALPALTLAARPKDAIKLSDVKSLTLRGNGAMTNHRRVGAIPQLRCVSKKALCEIYDMDVMRCTNDGAGWGDEDVQWSCTASLPEELKLTTTDVICEGYNSPDDPYVLKGSCGVEYRVALTRRASVVTPTSPTEAGSVMVAAAQTGEPCSSPSFSLVYSVGLSTRHATEHRKLALTPTDLDVVATAGLLADGVLVGVPEATILPLHTPEPSPHLSLATPGGLVSGAVQQEEPPRDIWLATATKIGTIITTMAMAVSDEEGQEWVEDGVVAQDPHPTSLTVTRALGLVQPAEDRLPPANNTEYLITKLSLIA